MDLNEFQEFLDSDDEDEDLEASLKMIKALVDSQKDEFPVSIMKLLPSVRSLVDPGLDTLDKVAKEAGLSDQSRFRRLYITMQQAMIESVMAAFVEGIERHGYTETIFGEGTGTSVTPENPLKDMSDLEIHDNVENLLKNL